MSRLNELIDVLSDEKLQARSSQARRTHICKICQRPALEFKSAFSKLEYELSTICEDCQKYYYSFPDD